MDYNLKQWRNQYESEQPPSAKIPRLLLESHQQPSGSALPLFVPEPNSRISNLSAFPDSTTTTRFPRMGGYFSLAQWQELELQALIFKYMLAGAAVPPELLQPIKKSLLSSSACYLQYPYQQYQHYQPSMLQSGYWGRSVVDSEPGRCRRTDGKKWRCSRDVVAGHKYCERHMHRGRNRSRKPVEIPTPATATGGGLKNTIPVAASPLTAVASGSHFALSGSSPSIDLFQLNQRSSEGTGGSGVLVETHQDKVSADGRTDGRILRHFFDDWPRSHQEPNSVGSNASPTTSTTCLSISTPGNATSDFSLKLSTGNGDESGGSRDVNVGGERHQLNWASGWGTHPVPSMGGPLAEALRSSTSNSSPTSVLHELPRATTISETSSVST
ncbi:PREDICTED: growth-regulating factor 3 [Nelumbo nucifera]|uniref:Growth-regulating factor n=1 Tax=Nelumbo nucifera TaxID=4432 RepID=A0A1U7Z9W6_NELNU|nr:PREDICTED: growth-regulating factor 3 [Nelumbo nucifera]